MNGHIVIPHRSHFTWQRTALVISQDFAGLQLAVLNLPATAVQRETAEAKLQEQSMISHIKLIVISYISVENFNFKSREIDGSTFYTELEQRTRKIMRGGGKKERGKLLYDVGSGGTIIRRSLCSI